jgi:hypothetical protein
MSLDINTIQHNYIIRMVVFSLFLHKGDLNDRELFTKRVQNFLKTKIPSILSSLKISFPPISKEDRRLMVIDKILYEDQNLLDLVVVTFSTPLKLVNLQVDLSDWEKWESFLNG